MTKNRKIAFVLNIIIIITEIMGFYDGISKYGLILLGFYTQQSNLVLLISCILYAVALLKATDDKPVKKGIQTLHFIGISLVAVTFIVVILLLIPMSGFDVKRMYSGSSFYHHLLCPVLAFISYLIFEKEDVPTKKDAFIAMLPTLFYAIVTTSLNVAKVIVGPYPFLHVYEQPVWMSVMFFITIPLGGYGIAVLLRWIKNKVNQ